MERLALWEVVWVMSDSCWLLVGGASPRPESAVPIVVDLEGEKLCRIIMSQ